MHVSKNSSTVSSVSDRPVSKVAEKKTKKIWIKRVLAEETSSSYNRSGGRQILERMVARA